MRGNRRRDTKPERLVRSVLHRAGYRFYKDRRLHVGERYCRPDIVFPGSKLAVFIDGCFWHNCPLHGRRPGRNVDYWQWKIGRNVQRDAENNAALSSAGWHVLRIWEHTDPLAAAAMVEARLISLRGGAPRIMPKP